MFLKKYNLWSPEGKRVFFSILIVVLSIAVACILLFVLVPLLSKKLSDLSTYEIITSLTVIVSIIAIAITLVKDTLKNEYAAKHTISLSVKVQDDIVIFTCLFRNESRDRIKPRNFYLLIDGALDTDEYGNFDFANILHHQENDLDCKLGIKCKESIALEGYPTGIYHSKYENVYHNFYHLKHISPNSVSFIDPGEVFTEDIATKFNPGVYRAILVGTSINHDCMCANIQFVVQKQEVTAKESVNTGDGENQ
jgi:hypothetical protein